MENDDNNDVNIMSFIAGSTVFTIAIIGSLVLAKLLGELGISWEMVFAIPLLGVFFGAIFLLVMSVVRIIWHANKLWRTRKKKREALALIDKMVSSYLYQHASDIEKSKWRALVGIMSDDINNDINFSQDIYNEI